MGYLMRLCVNLHVSVTKIGMHDMLNKQVNHDLFFFLKLVKMWLTAVGFALAMTKKTPACSAFVIQIFVPLRMK